MRHIFTLIAIAAIALTSCNDKPKNQRLDPNAMISLRPDTKQAANAATKANPEHLSAIEIVKQTAGIMFYNKNLNPTDPVSRGFADAQRDTLAPRLMMWGIDIISGYGEYNPSFIEGSDVVLIRERGKPIVIDTLGYVPNSVLRNAQPLIKAAFDAGDYATCYDLFDKAFVFRPITGVEWRELKAQGDN